ncbi:hypothetical protein GGX14DRAFT_407573 [Mycena pura]|uniref:Uncharacterized protein n=1 Tax=Mycena pura TaxID=153505 RepID=A0AAD6UN14_9AGAR|nr:hypothetical protein GGX14DRAFT_407573 [Mycena pura]
MPDKTSGFLKTLPAPDRQAIRAQVRMDDASGANRQNKHDQIVHMKEVVDKNFEKDTAKKDRLAKVQDAIAQTMAILSVEALDVAFQIAPKAPGYLTVAALDLQLDWHVANALPDSQDTSASGIPKAKTGAKGRGNRDSRYGYLKEAITRRAYISELDPEAARTPVVEVAPQPSMSMDVDVDDPGYDSEEVWFRS